MGIYVSLHSVYFSSTFDMVEHSFDMIFPSYFPISFLMILSFYDPTETQPHEQ